ncbi:hypothetical protein ACIPN8_36790 [Streptomyces sp. NPDC086082]|uniref:hypothetical protein n=1 Tax=Streptomyces sp. NPDC086082 TaxID=3365750 RepID=UPI003823C3FB
MAYELENHPVVGIASAHCSTRQKQAPYNTRIERDTGKPEQPCTCSDRAAAL